MNALAIVNLRVSVLVLNVGHKSSPSDCPSGCPLLHAGSGSRRGRWVETSAWIPLFIWPPFDHRWLTITAYRSFVM